MSAIDVPCVSVVLPVYNGAGTIAVTIRSVLEQSFAGFELLVINDGSTDTTREIVREFTDPRIKLHDFENKGLAASRNRGIRLAGAAYVAFIDADDLWSKNKLADQVDALETMTEAGLAYSLTDCIDEAGHFAGPGSHIIDSGRVYEHLLIWNFIDNGSNPMVRREVFDRIGHFDESLAAAEDWDVWLRIAHAYSFACCPEVQIFYRVHHNSMSSNLRQQEAASFRVFNAAVARLEPGSDKDTLERQGRANLNRYFAGRLLTTAAGPRAAMGSFRYLWNWLRLDTDRRLVWRTLTMQFLRACVLSALPHAVARPLLARLNALRYRTND